MSTSAADPVIESWTPRIWFQAPQEIDWIDEKFISFSDSKDPDHKYIAEILLASGLLISGPTSSKDFSFTRSLD